MDFRVRAVAPIRNSSFQRLESFLLKSSDLRYQVKSDINDDFGMTLLKHCTIGLLSSRTVFNMSSFFDGDWILLCDMICDIDDDSYDMQIIDDG